MSKIIIITRSYSNPSAGVALVFSIAKLDQDRVTRESSIVKQDQT